MTLSQKLNENHNPNLPYNSVSVDVEYMPVRGFSELPCRVVFTPDTALIFINNTNERVGEK